MSPRIEGLTQVETENLKGIPYFEWDLNEIEQFDPTEFDGLAKLINYVDFNPENAKSQLKFVVIADIAYIFSTESSHAEIYDELFKNENLGQLQCAGFINIYYNPGGEQTPYREIEYFSTTLKSTKKLTQEDSDKYKFEIMSPRWNNYFNFL